MTYPPQQPGPYGPPPGGYGQQPGQNPPPGGFPQQPGGYPQTGGQPQQPGGYPPGAPGQPGGYPQTGGFPQQPGGYPQTGGFGQPGAYGQQPGGFQPGYPAGGGPQKSKTPIILAGVGVLVVLLVIFVGGFAWPGFFTGGSTSSPTDVANSFLAAAKGNDLSGLDDLLCTKPNAQQLQQQKTNQAQDKSTVTAASIIGTPSVSGSTATAQVSVTDTLPAAEGGKSDTETITLNMQQQNGGWCISNNFFGEDSGGPSAPPSPSLTLPSGFPSVEPSLPSSDGGFGDSEEPSEPSDIPSSLPGDGSGG